MDGYSLVLKVVGYDTLSYPLLFSRKLVCLSSLLVLPAAACFATTLTFPSTYSLYLCVGWLPLVLSKSCLPVLICTDLVGAAGSAEYESEVLQGGYFIEFDDTADE